MDLESIIDDQSKCELLKYEIRTFSIQYFKVLAERKRMQIKI